MTGKFEVYTDKAGEFRIKLKAVNGQLLLASEGYRTKSSCLNALESIRKNALVDSNYERKTTSAGLHYFTLKAQNGQVIGTSESYATAFARDVGIEAVRSSVIDVQEDFANVTERPTKIGSVTTYLSALEKIDSDRDSVLFYRGHSNHIFSLVPSIYRDKGWIQNEDILYKELILRCPADFYTNESTFQSLVKMQHYSLPTRLLDMTTNPLIALYFATADESQNGEVVVLSIPKREIKYFDSDTVSVLANISRRPAGFSLPEEEVSTSEFNSLPDIKFLLHEIKHEKPYFEAIIDSNHLESVVCVKPKLDNARIVKQDGAFLLFGINKIKTRPAIVPNRYMATSPAIPIIINSEYKQKIRAQLAALGITEGSIYPEIERVASHIKESYSLTKSSFL